MAARFALGLGEAANFPAGIKAVAEWFPRRERALAAGLFNAGTNVGALTAPLLVPWLTIAFGWQWAFVATGALGFVWLLLWLRAYRLPAEHPRLSASELAHIRSDPAEAPAGIVELIFSGGAAIRLDVECVEAQLSDIGGAWEASSRPTHKT